MCGHMGTPYRHSQAGLTHMTENITISQFCWRAVINCSKNQEICLLCRFYVNFTATVNKSLESVFTLSESKFSLMFNLNVILTVAFGHYEMALRKGSSSVENDKMAKIKRTIFITFFLFDLL